MVYNVIALLIEILKENDIPPEKLNSVLDKYLQSSNEYLKIIEKQNNDVSTLAIREFINTVQDFNNLLEYFSLMKR